MLLQVNDILDFNKIEAGMLEIHPLAVNLKVLLLNSAKPFYTTAHDKKLELLVEIDPQLDTVVLLDDVRFIQILNNLYSNAIKFTHTGHIKLKAVCENKNSDQLDVLFAVEDTGQGIAPQDQKRIFDSFSQVYDEGNRKITGTGLGLNISKRLIKLMGSKLELNSETGKGSSFFFRLKLKEVDAPATAVQTELKADEDLAGVKILLVEDNKINVLIAKKILSDYKATVTIAYDGAEALTALEHKADYTIILMDLEMPVMNGYEAILTMKKLYPAIPVLAFTAAMIDREKLLSLQALGFEDCILKPFQPHELLIQVKKYIKITPLPEN
jgi:CheY-like chemotaxis protein